MIAKPDVFLLYIPKTFMIQEPIFISLSNEALRSLAVWRQRVFQRRRRITLYITDYQNDRFCH